MRGATVNAELIGPRSETADEKSSPNKPSGLLCSDCTQLIELKSSLGKEQDLMMTNTAPKIKNVLRIGT